MGSTACGVCTDYCSCSGTKQSGMAGRNGGRTESGIPKSESRMRQTLVFGLHFLFTAWGVAQLMVPSIFRTGIFSSVTPFWRHHHGHIHQCVSMVILKPVKLLKKSKHHRVVLDSDACWRVSL